MSIVTDVALPWLQAFSLALAPVIGGLAVQALRKRGVDTAWFEAIGRAGGVAYTSLLKSGRPVTDRAAMAQAAADGAGYLAARVPGMVLARNLSDDALAQIAGAELGKRLGLDPTVAPVQP